MSSKRSCSSTNSSEASASRDERKKQRVGWIGSTVICIDQDEGDAQEEVEQQQQQQEAQEMKDRGTESEAEGDDDEKEEEYEVDDDDANEEDDDHNYDDDDLSSHADEDLEQELACICQEVFTKLLIEDLQSTDEDHVVTAIHDLKRQIKSTCGGADDDSEDVDAECIGCNAFAEMGGPPILLVLAKKWQGNERVQAHIFKFLHYFCSFTEEQRKVIINFRGVDMALEAMKAFPESPDIQKECMDFVSDLLDSDDSSSVASVQRSIARLDGVMLVLEAMQVLSNDYSLQESACNWLRAVFCDGNSEQLDAKIRGKAICGLCTVVQNFATLQSKALHVLKLLCSSGN